MIFVTKCLKKEADLCVMIYVRYTVLVTKEA